MKKLHISLIFSKLEVTKPIIDYIAHMHNFIVKFGKILDINQTAQPGAHALRLCLRGHRGR